MRTRWGGPALTVAVAAFLAAFLIWPLLGVVTGAFQDQHGVTLKYLVALVTSDTEIEAFRLSVWIALWVTAGSLAVAVPLAWLFARRAFPGKAILSSALLLPLLLPPFVGAVGMRTVFARAGPLSTLMMRLGLAEGPVDWLGSYPFLGIVVVEVLHLFPILYLNLVAAFANVDPTLEEAARNLGASPWRVFRRVTLPLAAPGLFGGGVLVFVWSFTELGTPLVFGLRTVLPVKIFDSVSEIGQDPLGHARVVFLLLCTLLGFWLSKTLSHRGREVATLARTSHGADEKRLSPGGAALAWLGVGALIAVAVIPHVSVALLAVTRRWFLTVLPEGWTGAFFHRALSDELTRTAVTNSFGLALAACALDLALGFAIAWLCVRRKAWGADWLDALAMLPLAVPGLIIAFGYLSCFPAAFGGTFLDGWLNPRTNPLPLLALSYAVRRLPYMVRAAHAGLEQVSVRYEEAAANHGAPPLSVLRRVTVPLIGANLLAGALLCFCFSMLEVSDSLILAQREEFYPLTKAIYALLHLLDGVGVAAALGMWAMALLAAGLLWASCLLGKRLGAMFRAG